MRLFSSLRGDRRRGASSVGKTIGVGTTSASRRARLRRMVAATASPKREHTRPSLPRICLTAGTIAILSVLLCIHLLPNRIDLHLGDIAEQEVVAQRSVQFEDTAATTLLREDASRRVEKRYLTIPGATAAAVDSVAAAFELLDRSAARLLATIPDVTPATPAVHTTAISRTPHATPSVSIHTAQVPSAYRLHEESARLVTLLRAQQDLAVTGSGVSLDAAHLEPLLTTTDALREKAQHAAVRAVERSMSRSISDDGDDLVQARSDLARDPTLTDLGAEKLREGAQTIAAFALRPTRRFDDRGTDRDKLAAETAVAPQVSRLSSGQVIIRPGERVTQHDLDAFAALGLQSARLDALTVVAIVSLITLFVGLVAIYLRRFHRSLYDDTARLLLLALLAVFSVIGLKIGSTLLGLPFSGVHFGYLGMMCVAAAGMVIALLISPSVATLIVGLLSIASGLILNNELRFTVITLGSSLVAIVSVARLRNRGDLMRAMITLCGANVVLNVLVGQLQGDLPQELLYGACWGVVSGLIALVLFWVGVAAVEKPFGITTHLRLLELSDPATPVLQEFRMQVPGTYAHSLMVGNLAHAAADAIGADALLVRVAAYYHDLGKMNRPEFFIENQANAENIHDRISPSLSALILISHVKEGMEMAEGMGLPPRVREVIQQHHGTTLMKYFYHRATGGVPNPTLEAQFRYPGPKPQTKEAAILMLADGVEAASRTLDKPTPTRIAEFVDRMLQDKLTDGQLDECDLTMRDLRRIQDVFTRTLCGTLHARIEYPNSPANRPAAPAAKPAPALTLVETVDPEEEILKSLGLNPKSEDNEDGAGVDTPNGEPAVELLIGSDTPSSSITPITPITLTASEAVEGPGSNGNDAENGTPAGTDTPGRGVLGRRPGSRAKTARGGR